ncbi:holo-ACP synthase [Lederbergia wuyishanensis]|uniref:Holo-[acyl-carrier-protein] synthase n=1 Tax=Lederbergia wuyishanensis TaxID=1347903 RepID=A0ABU0D9Y8_9BACI|nr:holo-ACP synthase [Lederbergia wuyishanensis]MCJ8008496.1 holo-ACP synthase [Lederbergia wuyishanensis]MDQ0345239.1 holo-[acyl-carrier protein] synthase [Lederbergia wuyishanensis]
MIIGIGMDLVEIDRIEQLRIKQERFPRRILTKTELEIYENLNEKRKTEFLAGRFAAKEAYSKARGTGIGSELSFLDIEISTDGKGKPIITSPVFERVYLSITHTKSYAAAQVIIESQD